MDSFSDFEQQSIWSFCISVFASELHQSKTVKKR